ncbi:patatin-like phospholipase family protein [Kribbella monticola]|uniref:patatin-like phospholipase family protein n=1 Tax=Kribbella monticola TaxID=2185285 RepID=UPI000DD3EEB1|nr:patatin-like phospholipase family protein [Kribbella monticola]
MSEIQVAEEPVRRIPGDAAKSPQPGTALCLSGGGYRAMVFHVGVLLRLNEARMLPELDRVSSVSGGSITAGVLAMNWQHLDFDEDGVAQEFVSQVVDPIRAMAGTHVDVPALLTGIGLPFTSVADRVVRAFRKQLFGKKTLQDLPDKPTFVINATNLESGDLMRFRKAYLADYRVGRIDHPDLPLAVAVAASSSFPPFLSPCTVDLEHEQWVTEDGNDLTGPEFRNEIRLSDGGVYDNLGLETAWKNYLTILVSDAGGHLGPDPDPPSDWGRHLLRVLKVMDNQVRALRKRQVIDSFQRKVRTGAYIGIRSHVADYGLADPLPVDEAVASRLAAIPTRLDSMDEDLQKQLINWGYIICDTGLRAHLGKGPGAGKLPYPDAALTKS